MGFRQCNHVLTRDRPTPVRPAHEQKLRPDLNRALHGWVEHIHRYAHTTGDARFGLSTCMVLKFPWTILVLCTLQPRLRGPLFCPRAMSRPPCRRVREGFSARTVPRQMWGTQAAASPRRLSSRFVLLPPPPPSPSFLSQVTPFASINMVTNDLPASLPV